MKSFTGKLAPLAFTDLQEEETTDDRLLRSDATTNFLSDSRDLKS